MESPLISIIVPIYNKASCIKLCLDSIQAQTFREFEVIMVDDGSTDDTLKICSQYQAKDRRFKIIHQDNAGVSSARQTGLNHSNGQYIIHVDPDDYVEIAYLESLFKSAITTNADIVICDYNNIINDTKVRCNQNISTSEPRELMYLLFNGVHAACWNKLIKSCIIKNIIEFPVGINMCEDLIFIYKTLFQCNKIAYVPEPLYNYVYSESSLSRSYSPETVKQLYLAFNILTELSTDEIKPFIQSAFCGHILPRVFHIKDDNTTEFNDLIKVLTNNIFNLPNMSNKTKIYYYLASHRYGKFLRRLI